MTHTEKHRVCQICGNERVADLHPGILVRPPVAELIQRQIGRWSEQSWICTDDLQRFRHEYVRSLLEAEKGEITALDQEVLRACPPEDCGGRRGYEAFLTAIQDPSHAEYEEMLAWAGGRYDPEAFDVHAVNRSLKAMR